MASFDILGFKNMATLDGDSFQAQLIQMDYEEVLNLLNEECRDYGAEDLDYFWLSDTFVVFSRDESSRSYSAVQYAAKHFIEKCIYSRIPVRGALAFGCLILSNDRRSVMGRAFVDAHIYGEDQNWIGLLLAPSAITKIRSQGLEPTHHDFVASSDIPMRKCGANKVLAYRFQNGSANFSSPLLPVLREMKHKAGEANHAKYDRTIQFIEKHYRMSIASP